MTIQYTYKATAEITPRELARLFWGMDDNEQVEFFAEIGRVVYDGCASDDERIHHKVGAEMQWSCLGRGIQADPLATRVLRSMAAGVYEHTLRYCDTQYANRDMPWWDELDKLQEEN